MKTLAPKLFALVLLTTILLSCAKEEDGVYFNENSEVANAKVAYSSIESEIVSLVNAHRTSLGLNALNTLNIVSGVADGHTDYMIEVGQVSHDNFAQRAQTLMNEAGAKTVGENVAYGFSTAEGVVKGWLNSDGHKKIIENPDYTHFGISMETNADNRNYFTNIFIKK
ncbi:MAG: CAP domain-containing protein [Lutibacter sp.]|nr:CAP domain-containing protein [Lutibacter sp.]MDT8418372.1 CAP domain-containing protein [Lutibacter sp.]